MKDAVMMPIRDMQKCQWWKENNEGQIEPSQCGEPGAFQKSLLELDGTKVAVPKVTIEHVKRAIKNCKRTVSQSDIDRINKFTREFGMEG